jgi:hypothetical protein
MPPFGYVLILAIGVKNVTSLSRNGGVKALVEVVMLPGINVAILNKDAP